MRVRDDVCCVAAIIDASFQDVLSKKKNQCLVLLSNDRLVGVLYCGCYMYKEEKKYLWKILSARPTYW